jgi:hypothetical protein
LKSLAEEAQVSLGQVYNVKELLADREWIRDARNGLSVAEPEAMLADWSEKYRHTRNEARSFYSLKPAAEIENQIATIGQQGHLLYALTGFSGAERLAPVVRYQRIAAYIQDGIEEVARLAGLKEVGSGANVTLLTPYDEGVFYGALKIDGLCVVSPIQLYLDLHAVHGRGEEAAEALLEQVIRPQWLETA